MSVPVYVVLINFNVVNIDPLYMDNDVVCYRFICSKLNKWLSINGGLFNTKKTYNFKITS